MAQTPSGNAFDEETVFTASLQEVLQHGTPKMNLIHRASVAIVIISSLQVALTGGPLAEGPDGGLSNVRLTGIVIQSDQRLAIFKVTGETRILSVGRALNGWKLDSISPEGVSLSGPGGTRTLQPEGDTTLVRQSRLPAAPAQPPPAAAQAPGQPQAGAAPSGPPIPPQAAVPPAPARAGAPGQPVLGRPPLPLRPSVPSGPMRP